MRLAATAAVAVVAISAGCGGVPTPPNSRPVSTAVPAPPSPIPLPPNDHGYVRIQTVSRSTACSITSELVACHTSSTDWHDTGGRRRHTVSVEADGAFHWVDADLGELQGRVTLEVHTYSAEGWTVTSGPTETTFANDSTGHGMRVSDQDVTPF